MTKDTENDHEAPTLSKEMPCLERENLAFRGWREKGKIAVVLQQIWRSGYGDVCDEIMLTQAQAHDLIAVLSGAREETREVEP